MTVKMLGNDDATYSTEDALTTYYAQQFTALSTGTVSEIRIKSSGVGYLKCGIYSDSGDYPASLLASQSTTFLTASGWNTVTLSSSASIVTGTKYWLIVICGSGTGAARNNSGGATIFRYKSGTYATAMPASFDGTGWTTNNARNSAIAGWGTVASVSSWAGTWGG